MSGRVLAKFFVLTYLVSWSFFAAAGYAKGSGPSGTIISGVLFLAGAIVPSLVAIALTARNTGRRGLDVILGGVMKWRVGLRWYLFAITYCETN